MSSSGIGVGSGVDETMTRALDESANVRLACTARPNNTTVATTEAILAVECFLLSI